MATYANLFVDQGSDFTFNIDLSSANSEGLDLTDYVGQGKIAKSYDGTIKETFTVSIDTSINNVTVSLTAVQTAGLKPGRYVYDVIIKAPDPDNTITRILEGQLDVTPGVTFDSSAPEIP